MTKPPSGVSKSTNGSRDLSIEEHVQSLLTRDTVLGMAATHISARDNLWAAGLQSLHAVQIMLEIEQYFGIEIPEQLLTPETFNSIDSIARTIREADSAGFTPQ